MRTEVLSKFLIAVPESTMMKIVFNSIPLLYIHLILENIENLALFVCLVSMCLWLSAHTNRKNTSASELCHQIKLEHSD